MKNKAKLAFELLEQEMEVIYKEDLIQFVGGSGSYMDMFSSASGGYSESTLPGGDCYFQSLSCALTNFGISVSSAELESQYNNFYNVESTFGVPYDKQVEFAKALLNGCNVGVQSTGLQYPQELAQTIFNGGVVFTGMLKNDDGTGHVVTVKGISSDGFYIYDDCQNGFYDKKASPSSFVAGVLFRPI